MFESASPMRDASAETLRDDGGLILSRRRSERGSRLTLAVSAGHPTRGVVQRLQHEYALRSDLDSAWAARPIELCEDEGRPAVTFDDPGGELLSGLVDEPLGVAAFLRVAIGAAAAIGRAHEHGLVHRDLKPANILADTTTGQAWLMGFGLASRLPRERRPLDPPHVIEGTLAYMSPEQTGRMNRSVDSRSDLYSLGVTFYETLTGELPFSASDPVEWIHCHIARQAPSVLERRGDLPAQIAAVVAKLLEKPAERRYQTAAGLEADLRRCLEALTTRGQIEEFPLGTTDVSSRLIVPERLYGRERDIETLLAAFERVARGDELEVVLVSGYSGIGKSSVVNELHKALVPARGLFAAGKFDQHTRDVPYATIAQAFATLVRHVLAQSEDELAQWRDALMTALGANGRIITDLIPELEFVIGPQVPVPELPPAETQTRFQMTVRHFLAVFAHRDHPLALFLDDLQWLDAATRKLLGMLVSRGEGLSLLLIGAFRDNEVHAAHPLTPVLDAIRSSPARVNEVRLAALPLDEVGALVADALHGERSQTCTLAELVHEKTAGNPFFAIEFLTDLVHENHVVFDAQKAAWTWDTTRIRDQQPTDNVVELMAAKLTRLTSETQTLLRELSCLGHAATASVLARVHGVSVAEIEVVLWEARRIGFLLCANDTYAFVHDRIQEAAYSQVPEADRAPLHLRIGRLLHASLAPDAPADEVFGVISQLNRALQLVRDDDERAALRRLNVAAGKKAKSAIAYSNARDFLSTAADLLPNDAWSRDYTETFDLYLTLAECEFLAGSFAVSDALFATILTHARSNIDRATAHCVRLKLYQLAGRYEEACTRTSEVLRLFDVQLPESERDLEAATRAEYERVPALLRGRAIAELTGAPQIADPALVALVDLFVHTIPCAYIASPKLYALVTLKAVTLSLEHGNTAVSCRAYATFAAILISLFDDIPAGYQFSEMALRLNEKIGQPRDRGSLLMVHAHRVFLWRHPFSRALPIQEQAFTTCIEVGDLAYASYVATLNVWQAIEKGDTLDDVLVASVRYASFARQTNNAPVHALIRLKQQFVANLQGKTDDPLGMTDATFDEAANFAVLEKATFGSGIAFYFIMKEILASLRGRFAEALAAATACEPFLTTVTALAVEATHHFHHGLALAALAPSASAPRRSEFIRLLTHKARRFEEWATHCPQNFASRSSLLQAELARVEERDVDAMRLYEQAIRLARTHRRVHDEALALETAARFYAARGFDNNARAHYREAQTRYAQWGAHAKVAQLEGLHRDLREDADRPRVATTIETPIEQLDVATVVRVLQALSAELVLEKWVERLMTIALEDAGATRGVLFTAEGEQLHGLAEATVAPAGSATATRLPSGLHARWLTASDEAPATPATILRYVQRTHETVLLDDAVNSPYAADPYVGSRQSRSIVGLPLVKQGRLEGILYLENNLAPSVFTPRRAALLRVLVSQAAISLENARLYTDLRRENDARRRTEEALRRSEAFLAQAQALSSTGSFGYNATTGELVWSAETYRIFEFERDGTPARERLLDRIHPEDLPLVRDLLARINQRGEDFEIEYRLLFPDGRLKHLQVLGQATGGPGSDDFVGAVMDQTAAKEMAQALAFRDQVMGIVGHDLRNPLAAVLGIAGLAQLDSSLSNKAREQIAQMERSAQRMKELVETLLDFTRTRFAGKLPVSPCMTDLRDVCARVVSELAVGRPDREITLDTDGDSTGMWDPSRIAQVISNLVGNALSHGDRAAPIRLRIVGAPDEVRLDVHNRGPAIAPDILPVLFEPFRRGRGADDRAPRGLGLGLHIAKQIVAAHGGAIAVRSDADSGTTFSVTLPRGRAIANR